MKNNIVVPQKATKTTNATLCLIPQNSQNGTFSHNDVGKINGAELSATKFFGKSFNVNKLAADVIRPIFSRKFHILTYICEKKFFWSQKIQKNRFFKNRSKSHMINLTIPAPFTVDWCSSCHNFFWVGNMPNNVHIERKLRWWRIQKFKNFSNCHAFLRPKR